MATFLLYYQSYFSVLPFFSYSCPDNTSGSITRLIMSQHGCWFNCHRSGGKFKHNLKFIDYYYEQLKLVCEQEEKFKKGLENRGSNNLGAASELANEEHITKELEASQEYFLQDMGQKESPNQFFLKLIQTFDKQINFYNLLFFSEDM